MAGSPRAGLMTEAEAGRPVRRVDGVPDRAFPIPPLARRIFDLMADHHYEARIAGGAVRDWMVSGCPESFDIADLDMAVAAPIAEAATLLRAAELRVVDTGLKHGTVTIVDGGQTVELTQTRVDVETDGRHAVVAFSNDWAQDAARRDFTINALYIDGDGHLHDPLGGMADLQAGILRFVGDARQRVTEDALRMLRYCRFLPRFGQSLHAIPMEDGEGNAGSASQAMAAQEARAALEEGASHAATLSGERVASECRKLLAADGASDGVAVMQSTGLARAALGVDLTADRIAALPVSRMRAFCNDLTWLVALAVAAPTGSAEHLIDRLRLSRRESRFLMQLDMTDFQQQHVCLVGTKWQRSAWFMLQRGQVPAALYAVSAVRCGADIVSSILQQLADWQPPIFPVTAIDLLSHGVDKGPAVGESLAGLQTMWVESDFTLGRDDLLAALAPSGSTAL